MLAGSGESIGTIAERCGFEDHAHFCQSYLARYGISPSGRRRRRD
jgi:transcriptional regulator GlxA family with amidase domain